MKAWLALLWCLLLGGCATTTVAPRSDHLFNDHLFGAASERISPQDVFAVSDAMRQFLDTEIAGRSLAKSRREVLVEALNTKGQLRLEYDAAQTRNAAQTFSARSGNCLALVLMTAALARELGVPVRYQSVFVDPTWSRSGNVYMSVGHVNLSLASKRTDLGFGRTDIDHMTIDFLPPEEIRGIRTRVVTEQTIVAMYMNNRAVEASTRGQLDDAYWWARAAIAQDPLFLGAYTTLGVVYRLHGNPSEAAGVFAAILEREPGNLHAMANLAPVLRELGRQAEATAMSQKLAQLEPYPPFSFFNQGMAAMRDGDFKAAKEMFAKEVDRAAYYHEFHFWLAAAYLQLGDVEEARKHLAIAVETSTTRDDRDLYSAKLARIRSRQFH
jgi:tetratricopeptide (TPR) repeat protein